MDARGSRVALDQERRGTEGGQSVVEFALILPLILVLLLAIVDFARLYTTILTVESAAREAADFGAFHWYQWQDAPTATATAAEMNRRACVAISNLPEYTSSGGTCMDGSFFAYTLAAPPGGPSIDCSANPDPALEPCRLTVRLTYNFRLLAPLQVSLFGTTLGLPTAITFSRDATFALSDFGIDSP
ncbi:MAG TPA: TadE/TadG family type IV pilus assembly protein [Candidatus Limnocylindrales bacterium]|nr:TadE/TadG family type IV pilus assembly protein [Candidatus Limnocylindrales bacterium]